MTHFRFLLPLLFVSVAVAGCDSDVLSDGQFAYTAFNEDEEAVATGSLQLEFESRGDEEVDHIEGSWNFSAEETGAQPCHWVDEGRLAGEVSNANGEATLDLNPGVTDNNLILNGRFEDNTFEGSWSVVTFAGVVCSGRFEAVAR